MQRETPELTSHGDLHGDKLYQIRARQALPLLVRNALAEQPIEYGALAEEMGMPNARNLNFVLGTIGNATIQLGIEWGIDVPPIQAIVINKQTQVPGDGFADFAPYREHFKNASANGRREIITAVLAKVFSFNRWHDVLNHFDLPPAAPIPAPKAGSFGSTPESVEHKQLKEEIAKQPELLGLPPSLAPGTTEFIFGSSDTIDVLFQGRNEWVGVEVKSVISDINDIARGIYQCVKYTALIQATLRVLQRPLQYRVILALGGQFPNELIPLRNALGVSVIDNLANSYHTPTSSTNPTS